MDYRCDWFKPHKGILYSHLWVEITVSEQEALIMFTQLRSPLEPNLEAVPPYADSPQVRFVLLAQHQPEQLLFGGDISYDPEMGFVRTIYGDWPGPWMVLRALARNEIAGQATQEALHYIYWFCICSSALLRAWFEKQYPEFWKLQLTAFPHLAGTLPEKTPEGTQDAVQVHDDSRSS